MLIEPKFQINEKVRCKDRPELVLYVDSFTWENGFRYDLINEEDFKNGTIKKLYYRMQHELEKA